jgi:hypothetical protein
VARTQSTAWNSLREKCTMLFDKGRRHEAKDLIDRAESISRNMARVFPNQYLLAQRTLDDDISRIRMEYAKKYSSS